MGLSTGPRNVLFDVWRLARVVGALLDDALADAGIDSADYGLYSLLVVQPRSSLSRLAELSGTPPTTLSRRLRALEAAGHVVRMPDADDRRAQLFELTAAGRAVQETAMPLFAGVLQAIEKTLGDDLLLTQTGLRLLERAVRLELGDAEPDEWPSAAAASDGGSITYGGPPLTAGQEAEVRDHIAWLRFRDGGARSAMS
ncbi:MAG TPA: MarR family winged helix-turn-helix transcriptional regulator [Jiangellaceae bacterium]